VNRLRATVPGGDLREFQKNNPTISTRAKVILSRSAERSTELTPKSHAEAYRRMTFAALAPENPLEIILRQAQDDFSLDTDADLGRF